MLDTVGVIVGLLVMSVGPDVKVEAAAKAEEVLVKIGSPIPPL